MLSTVINRAYKILSARLWANQRFPLTGDFEHRAILIFGGRDKARGFLSEITAAIGTVGHYYLQIFIQDQGPYLCPD